MRKLILSCILTICGVIPLWSQEGGIEVVGFRLLENDLTANTHGTSKKDGNGETAALIKIVSPEKGFRFQNGSLGIVGTEQDHVGETWLYLPPSLTEAYHHASQVWCEARLLFPHSN